MHGSSGVPLPQHESGDSQGYTRSVLSEGNITIGGQATSARALGIHTDLQNAHRSAEAVPDLQNLLDKQQTVAQSTAVIHSAVATYRGNRAKAAAEELEKQQAAYEGRLKEQNDGSYEQYAGKSDSERLAMRLGNAKYAQAYQEARSWGVGGSKSCALTAAETLITGALGGQGDLQLAANTLAPYAAAAIGKRFGHGEHKNEVAQAIGHFMLGAALAYANGADPLAGGSAAVAAERAAEYLAKQYDDGHTAIDPISGQFNPNLLPEHIKEEIKAQTGALASVVGAAGGSLNGTSGTNTNALFNAQVGGVLGQNAVENNALETAWDILNIGIGVTSMTYNIKEGNYGSAAIDGLGLVYDGVATAIPFLPGGASAGLKAYRAGNSIKKSINIGHDVTKISNAANKVAKNANTASHAAKEGTKIHKETARLLKEENGKASKLSSSAQSYFKGANKSTGKQPDTSWPRTNIWTDLTTAKEWNKHVKKYGSNFGEGIPILYERGKGIINSHKLKSGVGVTAQGCEKYIIKQKNYMTKQERIDDGLPY
ncbi:hypothetical protein NELON_04550 [Neisseria elongata subsp. glycolytica ATCC 29315]|uniref:Uncharacterized protein n=1 Tax=Neisseria elongata subsp. glycolytica ATCC 29315 TaxID=546263 RepID=A0A0B5CLI7_NEIEG|nr:VENN motif pre-toxin domain-containing protein [Neisseria elongata]AJE18234.1 hypothetical protein NELON_04550 [Neisseria elongata subsp. glycolytica ATCC 29315]SQH50090.1 large surface adhesin [Neisseria elongata subsp. glycolytica]